MKTIALIIMILFYGAYMTKGVLLKQKGIDFNRMVKGVKSKEVRVLEIVGMMLTYGVMAVQVLTLSGVIDIYNIELEYQIAGAAMALIGLMFFILGMAAMKNSWRAGIDSSQKTTLQTGGVLRYSRNPAFLGFMLFYLGLAMMMPNIWIGLITVLSIIFFHLQILQEEKFLLNKFGEEYKRYKLVVRRYL